MRLGELLLQQGKITQDQLRAALEAQRNYGGRLGTNLVHLGYLDVDVLARTLGQQLGVTAATRKHVAAIDKRVLSLFSARVVASYKAIPLGYTSTKPPRVVVACIDPGKIPVEELAFAAGSRVDVWVAPEVLVQECLERYFGAAPVAARYVDVTLGHHEAAPSSAPPLVTRAARADAGPAIPGSPRLPSGTQAAPPPASGPVRPQPVDRGAAPSAPVLRGLSPPPPPPRSARALPLLTPPPPPPNSQQALALSAAQPEPQSRPRSSPLLEAPPPPAPQSRPRMAPVLEPPPPPEPEVSEPEQIVDLEPPAAARAVDPSPPAMRVDDPELPSEDGWDSPEEPPEVEAPRPVTAPPDALRPVIDQAEASRMLEMATSKDHVGRVLEDWLRSTFGCGLVLVAKNDMLVGWKGFFPDAEDLVEAVAVPLNKPSMFSASYESREPFCGPPPEAGAKLDQRLWKLLRCDPPSEVLVCPVVLANRAVNLLYAHAEDGSPLSDTVLRQAQVVAGDASAAYSRLIRRERSKAR